MNCYDAQIKKNNSFDISVSTLYDGFTTTCINGAQNNNNTTFIEKNTKSS